MIRQVDLDSGTDLQILLSGKAPIRDCELRLRPSQIDAPALFISLLPDKLIGRQWANEDFLKVKSTQRGGGGVQLLLFITLIYSLRRRT